MGKKTNHQHSTSGNQINNKRYLNDEENDCRGTDIRTTNNTMIEETQYSESSTDQEETESPDNSKIQLSQETPTENFCRSNEKECTDQDDWNFWSNVVSNYNDYSQKKKQELIDHIHSKGVPLQLRGMVWRLLSYSRDAKLERLFTRLIRDSSPVEKLISKDISHIFPIHDLYRLRGNESQDSLFHLLRVYSIYDPDVGYCQGLVYVAALLLIHMPEEEAFSTLSHILFDYHIRRMYISSMDGLQVMHYQFDHLLAEQLPEIHAHLKKLEIHTSLFVSQWFLTLFSINMPVEFSRRFLDLFLVHGKQILFQAGLSLVRKNTDHLLCLGFEESIQRLKNDMHSAYTTSTETLEEASQMFVEDILATKIDKLKLKKYEKDFWQSQRQIKTHMELLRSFSDEKKEWKESQKKLENELEILKKENNTLAKITVDVKLELAMLKEDNDTKATALKAAQALLAKERDWIHERVKHLGLQE